MARGDEHRLGRPVVQPPGLDLALKLGRRVRGRMGRPMDARLSERVVHVGSAEDPSAVREQRAAQADVVARTVDAFVVPPGQNAERGERLGPRQHPLGEVRMQANALPIAVREPIRFAEDRRRHCQPTEVVYQAGSPDPIGLGRWQALAHGRRLGKLRDAA